MTYASPESIEVGKRLREVRSLEAQVANASHAGGRTYPDGYMDPLVVKLREARKAYDAALGTHPEGTP